MSRTLQSFYWSLSDSHTAKLTRWIALSLLLHALLLAWAPRWRGGGGETPALPPLTVMLRSAPPAQEVEPQPPPTPPAEPTVKPPPPRAAQKPVAPRELKAREAKPPEPVIALAKPAPALPTLPAPAPEAPPIDTPPTVPPLTTPPPAEADLTAFVEARRRARGEGVVAVAPEVERANRGALGNTALNQQPATTLKAPRTANGYGTFDIRRRGYDYAEYMFRGWNENFRRDGLELIEVRKGNHASIDIAVIRSIIGIIRRTENGDFQWHSRRLGRTLTLSARARDNAFLEEFLMQEFYDDLHRYR